MIHHFAIWTRSLRRFIVINITVVVKYVFDGKLFKFDHIVTNGNKAIRGKIGRRTI